MKNKSLFSIFGLVAFLSGCTALQTKEITGNPETPGIPYFLPKNFVEIKVTRIAKTEKYGDKETQKVEYQMAVKSILIPDTSTRFILKHKTSFMASDRLCVARSTTGLLQSVQFATDDKSDEIAVKLAELAAKVAKTVVVPPAALVKAATNKIEDGTQTATAIGDPADENYLTEQIQNVFGEINAIKFPNLKTVANRKCPKNAICFSTLINVTATLEGNYLGTNFNAATTALVVDFEHVGKLHIDRPFLVNQVTKLGFTDGVLTSVAFKRPSEGLALASLPLDILDAVLAVPANFFKTALGGVFSDQKSLLEQQKDLGSMQQQIRTDSAKDRPSQTETGETETSFKLECVSLAKS